MPFRTSFGERIFKNKYALGQNDTWQNRSRAIVNDVCGDRSEGPHKRTNPLMSKEDQRQLEQYITEMKFLPGGRYIYYAGRPLSFYNNCFVLIAEEDTREEWAAVTQRAMSCLMSGGGIGINYDIIRPAGRTLQRTGGISSGPIPLMHVINEVGRNVMQGGSRRSAILASLNWRHDDILDFIRSKEWSDLYIQLKAQDFNFPAPLDMTNISVSYDNGLLDEMYDGEWDYDNHCVYPGSRILNLPDVLQKNVSHALRHGEPGMLFNFGNHESEVGRNACGEFISPNDSDVCNLGSINLSRIRNIAELGDVVRLASKFLVCGTLRADLPYDKVTNVREQNRKIGLGLMGLHEWLLQRNSNYEMTPELREWMEVYKNESERSAKEHADRFYISIPKRFRAIAPSGTIGILAGTTTGIEPLFATAYKRRYLRGGSNWQYEFVIDPIAEKIIQEYDIIPETSFDISFEQRVRMQYDIQKYVDMGISSTINLPEFGSSGNNEATVDVFCSTIAKYLHGLRGLTLYPQGSRMGQPLTPVDYNDAKKHTGVIFEENEETCAGGVCSI